MTDIVFLKSVHLYDSYGDFFHLAELAGFPIRSVSDFDVSEPGVFITAPVNGDWREHMKSQANRPRNAHIIIWNIERPAGSAGSVGQYALSNRRLMYGQEDDGAAAPCRYADEVWVSDRKLADETSLRYVVLGSHPGLGEPGQRKEYNFVHMSYICPRRQTVLKKFDIHHVAPNGWGEKRDKVLKASKIGIAIHQDTYPFIEPLRFAIFAAYGLPILSETLIDSFPYSAETIITAPFDEIHTVAYKMLENESRWEAMGQRCRKLMTEEFEFGKMVRLAVSQSVGEWR